MAEAHNLIINPEQPDDRKIIPVFTVIKNNAILKNIFLLQSPPEMNNLGGVNFTAGSFSKASDEKEKDAILTVGRHPNCSIMLSHPSISRFHLQIRSKPSLRKLTVTDLSSVHGTWVAGKRIKPRDPVELNEGDELRMGGSSRVYKLHWVSACQAYDLDNPFYPASDVTMCDDDDIDKQEEEALFQDENGLLAADDVSLNSEANTTLNSCEDEAPLQRSVRKDTVLKGILKHRQESSHCMVKPLSFPLAAAEVREVYVANQSESAPAFSEMASERRTYLSQMVEHDDIVPLDRNFNEDHEQMKQLCSSPESCIEESAITRDDDCSQTLEVSINEVALLATEESPPTMTEKQFHFAEDQTKMPFDDKEGFYGTTDDKNSLIEMDKEINQSVIESRLFTTENEERIDVMLMEISEYSDVVNEALKSPPIDAGQAINRTNSDDTQHSKLESMSTNFVSDLTLIPHESVVKTEDKTQPSDMDTLSRRLMVNSAVRLERLREDSIVINSGGNGTLVYDTGIQILEPLLDSFVFPEKDTKESCSSTSKYVQSELKSQSPETLFYTKCITDNGKGIGSKTIADQRSNKSMLSSQRCQSLGALKILKCSSKEKRRGSTTTSRTQLHSCNAVKSVSKPILAKLDHVDDECQIYTPDKENFTPNTRLLKFMKKMGILDDNEVNCSKSYTSQNVVSSIPSHMETSRAILADLDNVESEVEIYTPDKENFTPNTRLLKSMKRMGLLDENNFNSSASDKSRSSKASRNPLRVKQKYCSASEKENGTPINDHIQAPPTVIDRTGNKKNVSKAERIPLQSLSINSNFSGKPDASVNKAAITSNGSVTQPKYKRRNSPIKNNIALVTKVKWHMVVDSTCFSDSESRKALQLLQGLKGTKLSVPGTVLRELNATNQHASLFCRTTEASAALKWLEDCLVNTNWWIHVQSSFEEVKHLAPTPPVSPKLHDSYHTGINSWKTIPIFRNFSEVPSPKAEDHILEYALQQMRCINDNERIVILSNNTSLRIKAMAEGLICERASEFRGSLVNPFSERFLWSESSPRGRTWSCQDDIVLKEQFYSHRSKNSSKEYDTPKGLKLIMAYSSRHSYTSFNTQWK